MSPKRCFIAVAANRIQSNGKARKWAADNAVLMGCLLSGRSRSGVEVGVGVDTLRSDSESESLKIRRLRSPDEKNFKGCHDSLNFYYVSVNSTTFSLHGRSSGYSLIYSWLDRHV